MSLLLAAALQHQKNPADEVDPIDPSSLTLERQITTNTGFSSRMAPVGADGMHAVTEHAVIRDANNIRLVFNSADGAIATRFSLLIDGVQHPITWGGKDKLEWEQTPGPPTISDPLPPTVVARAGTVMHSILEIDPGTGLGEGHYMNTNVGFRRDGPFETMTTYNTTTFAGSALNILGTVNPDDGGRSVGHFGDSFSLYWWPVQAYSARGWAWTHYGRGGEPTPTSIPAGRVPEGMLPFDLVASFYGGNYRYTTLEAQQARDLNLWGQFAAFGAEVLTCTLHPYGGHDETYTPIRWERNDWLRDGAPIIAPDAPLPTGTTDPAAIRAGDPGHPLAYPVFDLADVFEERNSGDWIDSVYTNDGIHLSRTGMERANQHYEQYLANIF